jgi:hypothetical protein
MTQNYVIVLYFNSYSIILRVWTRYLALHQYNGRYDFVFFGNTLNTFENGTGDLAKLIPAHQLY